jgi:hypothetical protein
MVGHIGPTMGHIRDGRSEDPGRGRMPQELGDRVQPGLSETRRRGDPVRRAA